MIDLNEYRDILTEIAYKYDKNARGAKYIRKWSKFFAEKNFIIETAQRFGFLDRVKTAIDIGTGVGVLPYLLKKQSIAVEGTDIDYSTTGPMFRECCDVINLKVHYLCIYNNTKMVFPGKYDIAFASRTEFDNQFLNGKEKFNYKFFLDDAFTYVEKIFIKTNYAGSISVFPDYLKKYLWNPANEGYGKPFRAWYILVKKQDWI